MSTSVSGAALDIDLQKYLLVLKRRWLPGVGVLGLVTALAMLFAMTREPIYQASGKVLVKIDRTPSLAGLDVPGTTSIGKPNAVGLQSDPIATEVETIISLPIAEKTIAGLQLKDSDGKLLSPTAFLKGLDVKPIPGTDMIRIGYADKDPEVAAAVINKVIEVYRVNNIATKQAEAVAARDFIAKQLPLTEATVRKFEVALQQFKEQNNVIVLDDESSGTVKTIQQLDLDIAQARAQLANTITRSRDLQRRVGMNSQAALQASDLSQSASIQDALTQIREVQSQLDLARGRYRGTHPTVISLERQEAILKQRLQNRVAQAVGVRARVSEQGLQMGPLEQDLISKLVQSETDRVSLISQVNELTQSQADQRRRASVFPRLEATQRELERKLTAAQTTYEALLRRSQDVQVAQNQTSGNIRVVSQALVPETPTSNKALIVLGGLLAGSLLGVITAFALDLCDRSVKTVGEAKELLDLSILGVIPLASKRIPQVVLSDHTDRTYMTQAYRMLQANLSFVNSHTGCKVIVVTSSVAQEGRSWIAANLALAMAQAGNRVLLIDADLQKPTQHQIWNCENEQGLIQVLEKTVQPEAIMQSVAPNVLLVPLGKQSPNSLATFSHNQINVFIKEVAQNFDIVLFDTPPLTQTADASTLGTLADGTLMVIRPGLVKADDVKAARGLLMLAGQPVLGMVVNGVEHTANPNKYFAYAADQATSIPNRQLPASSRLPALSHQSSADADEHTLFIKSLT